MMMAMNFATPCMLIRGDLMPPHDPLRFSQAAWTPMISKQDQPSRVAAEFPDGANRDHRIKSAGRPDAPHQQAPPP
jgi:hypothetical protein